MKILFSVGNAPGLPTGYGGQGMLALRSFCAAGADVAVLAWNLGSPAFKPQTRYTTEEIIKIQPSMSRIFETVDSASVPWGSISWYPNPYTVFPVPIQKAEINKMIVDFDADLFISLQDIFMFQPGPLLCLSAVWMPLHFLPVEHPTVLSLADFDLQLPISGWGALLLEQLHGEKHCDNNKSLRHIDVVPHGRNPDIFKQLDNFDKAAFRASWGWPADAFVCLLIASNSEESGRKAFDAQIQAFQQFADTEPRAWLHIHSEVARAYDIGRLLETWGAWDQRPNNVDISDNRMRTDGGAYIRGRQVSVSHNKQLLNVKEDELVQLYNAADVLLAATCSEGCGVPILEAQMCGCPVVTTRATAMWEETMLGISVKPEQWIARMDFNSGWYLPHSKGIAAALREICAWTPEEKQEKINIQRPRVVKAFADQTVIDKWGEILSLIKQEINSNYKSNLLKIHPLRRDMIRVGIKARKLCKETKLKTDILSLSLESVKSYLQKKALVEVL
jgi:glycosyltransferase involved in cell wall biosynthesis